MRNCRSSLKRKRARPLSRYDALAPELRRWLQQAALPWSITSAERLWRKRLARNGGDKQEAMAWLSAIENRNLAKDRATWDAPSPPAKQGAELAFK